MITGVFYHGKVALCLAFQARFVTREGLERSMMCTSALSGYFLSDATSGGTWCCSGSQLLVDNVAQIGYNRTLAELLTKVSSG